MAFGAFEMAAIAAGAMFKRPINAATVWLLKRIWGLLRINRPRDGQGSAHVPEAGSQIIDVTPVSGRIRE
ncbi:hypothetical protein LH20_04500 [Sphingopyxis sp. 113P3]|nr:hypothetical protein LH20_04500 [Sphingopyxis sp. 113P3]